MIDDIQFIDEDEQPELFWAPCVEEKDLKKSEGTDHENVEREKVNR